jgi:putative ABC transport system permease protein
VSSRYFDAMRIPLVRGRLFREEDREESEPVAIVSERFALQYFPGEDPIGRRLRGASRGNPQEFRTIVGVVADIRVEALETEPRPHYYSPIEQESDLAMAFVVRTAGARPGISEEIASAVRSADPDLPVYLPRSMEEVTLEGLRDRRLAARLTASFALVALALAVLGIYGVTSYGARRRTREVGIRMALGAERGEILKMVVARGMRLALAGIALGLVLALSAARLLTSLLYEVSPADPASFLGIAILLAGSAFAASYLPARRAARLDPLTALRHE